MRALGVVPAMLDAGDPAPDFDLLGPTEDGFATYRLSAAANAGPVVLAFYEFDFSPSCADALETLRDADWGAVTDALSLFGVSGDGPYAHRRFAADLELGFPLLVDREGYVADLYGVLDESRDGIPHVPRRSLFVVDESCTVRYAWRASEDDAAIDVEPVLETLSEL
jgi:peroxiredoxin